MRFALPLIALALTAPAAFAAPSETDTVTVRIAYGDVDVASFEGRAVLEARIETKLRKACVLEGASRFSHSRNVVDDKCVADARTVALAEVERIAAADVRRGRAVAAN